MLDTMNTTASDDYLDTHCTVITLRWLEELGCDDGELENLAAEYAINSAMGDGEGFDKPPSRELLSVHLSRLASDCAAFDFTKALDKAMMSV